MKIVKKFTTITILLLSLSGCFEKKDENVLMVGLSPDYPPFEFQQNDQISGFDIDLANEVAKKLDKELIIKTLPIYNLISSLKNGNIDMIISGLSPTEARSKSVSFSDIYYKSEMAILYDASKNNFKSLKDLENKTIGAQTGTTMESFLNDSNVIKALTVLSQDTNNQLIEHLKIGRIDAIILDLDQAISFSKASPNFKYFSIETPEKYGFAIVLPKDKRDLLIKVNQIISELKENGELDLLAKKWLSKSKDIENTEIKSEIKNDIVDIMNIEVMEDLGETSIIIKEQSQDEE